MEFINNYSPVGDICVMAICLINWILLASTYAQRQKNLIIFHFLNLTCFLAAADSIVFRLLLKNCSADNIYLTLWIGKAMYILLILMFVGIIHYLANVIRIEKRDRRLMNISVAVTFLLFVLAQLTSQTTHFGLYINEEGKLAQHYYADSFSLFYIIFGLMIVGMLTAYSRRIVTKIRICLLQVMATCYLIMIIQLPFRQTSFTVMTFAFPIIAGLFLFHYNSYDAETGTLDKKSFNAYIKDFKGKAFGMVCMQLREAPDEKISSMSESFFHFNEKFFKGTCTFRISNTTMVLIYPKDRNPNDKEVYEDLLREFDDLYKIYKMEYKLTLISTDSRIKTGDNYLELSMQMEESMQWNTYKWCDESDLERYLRKDIIRNELKTIFERKNLDDERVLVYCQPVLNCETDKFTTAEALMRINLPGNGIIYPDEFIPIAEHNEYIHALSMIILHKTCVCIKNLDRAGYEIERISVNISMIELKDKNFCKDVLEIINDVGIEPSKIAIEVTESRNEKDREIVGAVMDELHSYGIKFYLDDFGTGYSNFEKIIGLPIDIIKFDRTLTIMSGKDVQSRFMVESFAEIFSNSGYQILFEGIENEADEKRCQQMKAEYLQGYKYSRPVPIEKLESFLEFK